MFEAAFLIPLALLSLIKVIELPVVETDVSLFDNRAFGLRSQIISGKQRPIVAQINIVEYYDPSQSRAKINYETNGSTKEFYYESTSPYSKAGLQTDSQSGQCQLLNKDDMRRALMPVYGNSDELIGLFNTIDKDIIPNQEYIVGPASVLYLLAEKSMSITATNDVVELDWQFKNIDIECYVLNYSKEESKASISILYSAQDVKGKDLNTITRTILPAAVFIETSNEMIQIFYYDHWLYSVSDYIKSERSDTPSQSGEIAADLFVLPLYADCPLADSDTRQGNFLALPKTGAIQYSFTALLDSPKGDLARLFVAFDGISKEARLDSERFDEQSANWHHGHTVVLDFNANRKYVIAAPEKAYSRCSTTYIYPTATAMMSMMQLKKFLFGVDQGIYDMGRAIVRGIRARVFKARVRQLPYWFGQPIVYINDKGKRELRQRGQRLSLYPNPNQESSALYALIYVTVDGGLASVLQYELRESIAENDRLVLRAPVFNFVWRLSESPGGDSALKLFDHQEVCFVTSSGNHEQHNEVTMEFSSTDPIQNINWFHSQVRRDHAIKAELRKTLGISSLMMYDFESFLTGDKGSVKKFLVHFIVAEHPKIILNVRFWNRADLLSDQADEIDETIKIHPSVQTFSECLWMVGQMGDNSDANQVMRSSFVLFSEDDKTCTIDTRSHTSNRTNSKFFIRNDGAGELFQVEPTIDPMLHLNQLLNRNLEQTVVTIKSYDDATGQLDPSDLNLRIEKVRIRSFKPIPTPGEIIDNIVSLNGFRLVRDNHVSWAVQLDRNESSAGIVEEDEMPLMLDFTHCEAACLSNFNCITYSYCEPNELNIERGTSVYGECVLSKVDLNNLPASEVQCLRQHISSFEQRIQLNTRDGLIKLERRGFCSVHRKRYINLFVSKLPERRVMNQDSIDLQQVESNEKCAELCVAKSAGAIRQGKRITEEVNDLIGHNAFNSMKLLSAKVAKRVEDLRKEHKQVMEGFCSHYMFLDETMSEQQSDILKQIIAKKRKNDGTAVGTDDTNGVETQRYCALDRKERRDRPPRTAQIIFDQYGFDFSKLYSPYHGTGLLKSDTTEEESVALVELQTRAMLTQRQLNILLEGIRNGKNYQIVTYETTISDCAKACFKQQQGVWPSCRSFDVKFADKSWGENPDKTVGCLLNTAHIDPNKPLARQKLVQTGEKTIHFELIPELLPTIEAEEALEEVHTMDEINSLDGTEIGSSYTAKFFIILFGLATGTVVALYGHRWIASKRTPAIDRRLLQSDTRY